MPRPPILSLSLSPTTICYSDGLTYSSIPPPSIIQSVYVTSIVAWTAAREKARRRSRWEGDGEGMSGHSTPQALSSRYTILQLGRGAQLERDVVGMERERWGNYFSYSRRMRGGGVDDDDEYDILLYL